MEQKLAERADLRLKGRALEAWLEHGRSQELRRSRLRAAVRRTSFLKLSEAFAAWRALVALGREEAEAAAAREAAAVQHLKRWRLRRALGAWRACAERARQARQLLARMARQAALATLAACFAAWHGHVAGQRARVAALAKQVAVRQQAAALRQAFASWRVQTDDQQGLRMQLSHAHQLLARRRLGQAFQAWRGWQLTKADRRQRWEATVQYMQRRVGLIRASWAFGLWQEWCAFRRQQRELFYRLGEPVGAGPQNLC